MSESRAYGVLLTNATAIYLNHPKYATPTEFAVAADWTPAAGDVKVSINGGAAADITNLPTYVTNVGWRYILTAAELTSQQTVVRIADSATKVIVDDMFVVETFGNASSMLPDPTDSTPVTAALSTTSLAAVVDAVWDEALSGHTTVGTAGRSMQTHGGAAQSGTSSGIVLAAAASSSDSYYVDQIVVIVGGTGVGQARRITSYTGATRTAGVDGDWATNPDSSSRYVVIAN
jgi:hypothetical protein